MRLGIIGSPLPKQIEVIHAQGSACGILSYSDWRFQSLRTITPF
jgi:hypothetical protein